ncbi:hypothetical protein HZS_5923 [Henneguya salminicola]|nr:hypothetical protein HZS_5923 [Henneguya salminicola]
MKIILEFFNEYYFQTKKQLGTFRKPATEIYETLYLKEYLDKTKMLCMIQAIFVPERNNETFLS